MRTRQDRLWQRLEKIMRMLRIDQLERQNEIKRHQQKLRLMKTTNELRNAVTVLLLALISQLSTLICSAADLSLAWDPSPGATNYILYASQAPLTPATLTNAAVKISVGTNTTATVQNLATGQWYFGATAFAGGMQSDLSNILVVGSPVPPANMRTVFLQYSFALATNGWNDMGFFRLKIGP